MIELALGLYFTATVFYALANGIYGTLPFLVLFQIGLPLHGPAVPHPAVRGRQRHHRAHATQRLARTVWNILPLSTSDQVFRPGGRPA